MTLYLKYRPQTVAELDETAVRESMEKILTGKDLPHAWLFSGPRGTGKTSSARILAKAINCLDGGRAGKREGGISFEPCNKCVLCLEIMGGNAPDVIEIDAASNRGIEEIRDLREKVRLAPMQSKYKVYIIDEVHMLTTEAANALLKTLEEPPEYTIFILCTTDPEKLPETVVSRCTRIVFRKPSLEESIRSLERVVNGEKVQADRKALELVARESRGSFRDGTKILEQILLLQRGITEETVREATGQSSTGDPEIFLELWSRGDQKAALEFINKLTEEGANLRSWTERAVEILRQQLLSDLSQKTVIIEKIKKLDKAYEQMKIAAVPQLPLEIMILESAAETPKPHREPQTTTPASGGPAAEKEKLPDTPPVKAQTTSAKGKYNLEDINEKWTEILKAVKPKNHSVEGLLRSTKAVGFDGEKLTLEVFYKFHKDKLETEKCRSIVEGAIGEVFGITPVKLFLQLGQKAPGKDNLSGQVGEDIVAAAAEIFKADVM